jgi:protein-S-isoprenylcysteine O-methyltransferase Ste14
MPNPLTDLPNEFVAATTASLQAQREKQARRVRMQRILVRIVFGLSACEALFALAAYLYGDHAAARFCAVTGCIVFALAYISQIAVRKKAVDAVREMDQST